MASMINMPGSKVAPSGALQQLLKPDPAGGAMQQLLRPDPAGPMQHLTKGDGNMFMSSDESKIVRQIQETHAPDGRTVPVKPLLLLVDDIFSRSNMASFDHGTLSGTQTHLEKEDKNYQTAVTGMLDPQSSYIIERISCEIANIAVIGADGHAPTVSLLRMLSNYAWNGKLVLSLAAFAFSYGEFWLLAQIYSSNPLARSMAILKQVPWIMEHAGSLKPRFDAVTRLLKSVIQLAKIIVAFEDLPSIYINPDVPPLSTAMATLPSAVYWSIKSIIASATQITSLASLSYDYAVSSSAELSWELSTFEHKINHIFEHLKKQLDNCHQHIDAKKDAESYESLRHIFDMAHIDNMKVLKAIIYGKEDQLPLFDGTSKRRVPLDVLRRKSVLLLISGLDISQDELSILEQIYSDSRPQATRHESLYELVWMPIVDHTVQIRTNDPSLQKHIIDDQRSTSTSTFLNNDNYNKSSSSSFPTQLSEPMQKRFEELRSTMQWYSVHHPSLIEPAVQRFVRERWHFRNKPILVVLDPQGRELSPNAIHMMWIWGSTAFPFTTSREEALWREETWRLELLVTGMDPTIFNWIREDKYIILYGGDDIDWIRRFTSTVRSVAEAALIPLEMAYVGKSNKKELVRRAVNTITKEKLSYCWQEPTVTWFFWTRLESMLFSKIQLMKIDDHQDPTLQEIKKLLSFDKSGGWALLSKGSNITSCGHAPTMLTTFTDYDAWKEHVPTKGFDQAFKDYHGKLHVASPPCCRFEFSAATGRIPDGMSCPECRHHMEKLFTFHCCHDETLPSLPY